MKNYLSLLSFLAKGPLKICIFPHANPDADALGASLALSMYLSKKGHSCQVISPTAYPSFLSWMQGTKQVRVVVQQEEICKKAIYEAELIFCVDFSSASRMGKQVASWALDAPAPRAVIDHHPRTDDSLGTYWVWYPEAAAAAELVFDFICTDNGESLIDKAIAECLYAGIATDTGSFRFSSVSQRLHHLAARLIGYGDLNISRINSLLYNNQSMRRLRFLGFALSKCLFVYPELYTAFFVLNEADMEGFDYQEGDSEGLVNYALSIQDIWLAALIKEQKGEVRLSLRSKGVFQVNKLAQEHFNGGGHRNAAGGTSNHSVEETVEQFKKLLPAYTNALRTEAETEKSQQSQ